MAFVIRRSSLAVILLLPLLVQAQDTEMLDAQNGFFDIQLGDTISSFSKIRNKGTYLKKDRYEMVGFDLQYGGAKFVFVDLLFFRGKLHSIYARTEGLPNSKQFLDMLQTLYGAGAKDGFAPRYKWVGQKVTLTFDQNLLTGNAEIFFVSKAVDAVFSKEYRIVQPNNF